MQIILTEKEYGNLISKDIIRAPIREFYITVSKAKRPAGNLSPEMQEYFKAVLDAINTLEVRLGTRL